MPNLWGSYHRGNESDEFYIQETDGSGRVVDVRSLNLSKEELALWRQNNPDLSTYENEYSPSLGIEGKSLPIITSGN